jgi:hypothetical protein
MCSPKRPWASEPDLDSGTALVTEDDHLTPVPWASGAGALVFEPENDNWNTAHDCDTDVDDLF